MFFFLLFSYTYTRDNLHFPHGIIKYTYIIYVRHFSRKSLCECLSIQSYVVVIDLQYGILLRNAQQSTPSIGAVELFLRTVCCCLTLCFTLPYAHPLPRHVYIPIHNRTPHSGIYLIVFLFPKPIYRIPTHTCICFTSAVLPVNQYIYAIYVAL